MKANFLSWSAAPQFVFHQIGWWACVLLMGWKGPLIMLLFIALHLWMTRSTWRDEAWIAVVATIVGIFVDNSLHYAGAVVYVGELTVGGSPLWLVAIWTGFGATLKHHQSLFVRRKSNALLIGCLGGPLAYLGGVKLERFTVDGVMGWLCIALAWTVAMSLLFLTVKGVDKRHAARLSTQLT